MNKETTNSGYINKNNQINIGRTKEQGTDHAHLFN
ncbi:hypothetical protein SAMN05443529_12018 [Desulfosporosinus hippei DSM 8344]|uniref:Uncharacterized protein n=1 Tax=Desulfosporosinus hippei DSM 8344 TaxID=1121419 RepID=A0A1G8FMV9_9FIRM|nr:hypothetical protein SAMN05443529_12018 [Desulfosporosinus hippei DSM 8344]